MAETRELSANVRRLRFMSAQETQPLKAKSGSATSKAKTAVGRRPGEWFAPGWEEAEHLYSLQQVEDLHQRSNALPSSNENDLLLIRRSFGGMNPYIESLNKKQAKKMASLAARREEEAQARTLQQHRANRLTLG